MVLGLLTSSVKSSFDEVRNDVRALSIQLIQLDRSLREWGPETQPARELLRAYTAAAIATTWIGEQRPQANFYPSELSTRPRGFSLKSPVMGEMLSRVELDIRQLDSQDAMHRRLETTCIAQFERLMHTRWKLVEEAGSSISVPFYVVLVFWLAIVFGSFGLTAPRNALSYTVMTLAGCQ